MGDSQSHKFGQIIGNLTELILEPRFTKFAKQHGLFFDKKGPRKVRGKGVLVTWKDGKDNSHRLDFVLERNGTEDKVGNPVAFVEFAWRRGTRHSKNKVQEIQAAINPIVEKFHPSVCFKGAVLAGDFTKPALQQLKSDNYSVLYFPTDICVKAFKKFGLKLKSDDKTDEDDYVERIKSWEEFSKKKELAEALLKLNKKSVDTFFDSLNASISRYVESIIICPLLGNEIAMISIREAVNFINKFSEKEFKAQLIKFEIIVKYNTGDRIDASFHNRVDAIDFLKNRI